MKNRKAKNVVFALYTPPLAARNPYSGLRLLALDAPLGGGVFKKRVARSGEGKSGGFRTIICFRKGNLAIFVYAFAKSDMENIGSGELDDIKKLAAVFLAMSWEEIELAVNAGKLVEIEGSAENV